ncbi:MAG TPA: tRNA dihydrouridine synthase DusB [Gemmatimonadetes bacterium]|jgi:nifR3 family TIM-barrel protein|nr:tRNA dihydrouridine synthase DusB [Gemmatimonadota bacterium]HIC16469.1 tRNA dihydrouridine synthase DusB [Gemmatimonadota bacterium]
MPSNFFELFTAGATPLYLAPQAGVSESPFRRLCRSYGADVLVSEFVSATGIVMGNPRSREYLRFDPEEHPIGIQIFGADPSMMADAAAFVAETYGPDFIDINFGCPVKKVVKRNGGSGCLRDLDLVASIIRAVDRATPLPTTVKIRSGFNEQSRDPVGISLTCQEAGASVLCLHPRTRADMYKGLARWDEIRAVVQVLDIPVVGNGDISSAQDVCRMKEETGCAGIMIARGSHGDPWIFREARAMLDGKRHPPTPDVEERLNICLEHAQNAIMFGGEPQRAIIDFRKHLGWYTKGLPDGRELRTELFRSKSLSDVKTLLQDYLQGYEKVIPGGAVTGTGGREGSTKTKLPGTDV